MIKKTSKFGVFCLPSSPAEQERIQIQHQEQIFDALTTAEGITFDRAKDSSLQERATLPRESLAGLTYGEVTLGTMRKILEEIRTLVPGLLDGPGGSFFDLGSGSGRSVIMAAVLHDFDTCCGVEILTGLYNISMDALSCWRRHSEEYNRKTEVSFFHGSLTDLAVVDWTIGDVVFVNSTCFHTELFDAMVCIARSLKPGAVIITLSADIRDPAFEILKEVRLDMSWGMADIFIHRRL